MVRFTHSSYRLWGDTLELRFDYTIQGPVLGRTDAIHLVPVYRRGTEEQHLPSFIINGRGRSPYYRRELALLSHEAYQSRRADLSMRYEGKGPQTVHYRERIVLPSGVAQGSGQGHLVIEQYLEDCCNWNLVATETVAEAGAKRPDETTPKPEATAHPAVTPRIYESSVTFIEPEKEIVKTRNERLVLHINYIVDRSDVRPDYANNATELAKVDRVLRPMASQRDTYRIRQASIQGYASPEAPYEYNLRLSQRRADEFKAYLIRRYGLHLSEFPAMGKGEDWAGLRRAVASSHMAYRDEVLSIIDGVSIFKGREKLLMDLGGGQPYKYMLRYLFPPLRRMEMEIRYTVRSFETVEADALIDERPQDLSQEEIYAVARKRNQERLSHNDREEYGKEYDVAARYFPDDVVANINASSAALVRGEMKEAHRYLSKVGQDARAYNNWGVYYWMQGDLSRAKRYFQAALAHPFSKERARYNLRVLEGLEQEENK